MVKSIPKFPKIVYIRKFNKGFSLTKTVCYLSYLHRKVGEERSL